VRKTEFNFAKNTGGASNYDEVAPSLPSAQHLVTLCLFGLWFNVNNQHGVALAATPAADCSGSESSAGVRGSLCIPWVWHKDYCGTRTTLASACALSASGSGALARLVFAAGETAVQPKRKDMDDDQQPLKKPASAGGAAHFAQESRKNPARIPRSAAVPEQQQEEQQQEQEEELPVLDAAGVAAAAACRAAPFAGESFAGTKMAAAMVAAMGVHMR
jgi:hypothetical protein